MMDTTQTLQSLLLMLCKTTSQHPMSDGQIASLKNIKLAEANAMLDKLYEAKAISSVKSIKDGKERRLVWVTGLPYRPALTTSKEITWQHLRTQPQRTQPAQPKQEPTMDDQPKTVLIVPTNLNEKGIKTPQKIVRFLFANTKATSNEIRKYCDLQHVDPFVKAYVRKGYIERTIEGNKLAVFSITPKGRLLGSADALYNQARVKQPSKMVATAHAAAETEKPAQNFLNAAFKDNGFLDDGRRYKPVDIDPETTAFSAVVSLPQPESQPIEFKLDTTQHIRFALTDEGTLMILGVQYAPIELSKEETKRLYEFAENTAHAI